MEDSAFAGQSTKDIRRKKDGMRLLLVSMLIALALGLPTGNARAQDPVAPPAAPQARPEDVESIDAILAALYDVISGPAGERDWDRFRSLMAPGALLVPAAPRQDGTAPLRALGVEDYIARSGPFFRENAFFEVEIGRRLDQYGNVASAMSAYASRRAPEEEPFQRGINAITLVSDQVRWYVVSIAWDVDREGNPLPADMAPSP